MYSGRYDCVLFRGGTIQCIRGGTIKCNRGGAIQCIRGGMTHRHIDES